MIKLEGNAMELMYLLQRCFDGSLAGSVYSNDLPVTRNRKLIYADDIFRAIQGQFFSELECSLSSDMAQNAADVTLLSTVAT